MRLTPLSRNLARSSAQLGLGLVELMVGITVGLIVAAGAAMVATRQIDEHRRLMLEVQLQQDLRIAADLLQQDLRRAGYRGLPANGVWAPARNVGSSSEVPAKDALSNPYVALTQTTKNGPDIFYEYAKYHTDPSTGINALNTSNTLQDYEQFGVQFSQDALSLQLGLVNGQPNWQQITDPNSVVITAFTAEIVEQTVDLDDLCDCTAGVCPKQTIRRVDFTIKARAKGDSSIQRTVKVSEKIRSDGISGVCPS